MDPTTEVTLGIKSSLDAVTLRAYIVERGIGRGQIITITEPEAGKFTLIYEPSAEQLDQLQADAEAEAQDKAERAEAWAKVF